jgi:hypothetical protein
VRSKRVGAEIAGLEKDAGASNRRIIRPAD